MIDENVVRLTLKLTAPLNLAAGLVFARPASSAAGLAGIPAATPPVYAWMLGAMIALFGVAYGWMSVQPQIDRPLLALGAAGKASVVVIAGVLWLAGDVPGRFLMLISGDLAFAGVWFAWLGNRQAATATR